MSSSVRFKSREMILREIYDQVFYRKLALEKKGFECKWILREFDRLVLTTGETTQLYNDQGRPLGNGYRGDCLFRNIEDGDAFIVVLKYLPSVGRGNLYGGNKVNYDHPRRHMRRLRETIADFTEVTGIELKLLRGRY